MKKLIIHICKDCKKSQYDQCLSTVVQLDKYFEYKGDKDTRITAYWSRQGMSGKEADTLILCHDKTDVVVFTWRN